MTFWIAADEVEIEKAAADLRREPGAEVVEARHLDLAKQEDIDKLHAAIGGRPIDVLTANPGVDLGIRFSIRTSPAFVMSSTRM